MLLANKIDLVNKDDDSSDGYGKTPEQMDQFCKDHGFITWFETSAKENTNVRILSSTGRPFSDDFRLMKQQEPWSKKF